MHVHVYAPDGEAKFWLEPLVALAEYRGLSKRELTELTKVVEKHAKEIEKAWKSYFG